MTCRADQQARVRRAARRLDDLAVVVATETIAADTDPTGSWLLDIVVDDDGVPAGVLATLADEGLTLRHAHPQGAFWEALATA